MKRVSMCLVCLSVLVLALSGCSRRQQEWEKAREADTIVAYETFLKGFPGGEFVSQARARIKELEEERDWQQAQATNTADGYQQFLDKHPDGTQSDEARIRIENFALAQTSPEQETPTGQTDALPEEAPPEPVPSQSAAATVETKPKAAPKPASSVATKTPTQSPAKSASTGGSGYRIQLGAFSGGDKQAMGEWRRLQREYPRLLGSLNPSVKVVTTSSGHLYRLQAGMTNETKAREICAALKAKKQSCVVVLP